jgi:hypothetical protein
MKLSQPRITPLPEAEWTDEQRKTLEPVYKEGRVYNVLGTLARHWEASKKFGVWAYAAQRARNLDFADRLAVPGGV